MVGEAQAGTRQTGAHLVEAHQAGADAGGVSGRRRIRIEAEGDSALMVRLAEEPGALSGALVESAARALEGAHLAGVRDVVPAYTTVMLCYDPLMASFAELSASVYQVLAGLEPQGGTSRRVVELPVCYGGELGPDLAALAVRAGMAEDEVVALHSGRDYRIDMLGFLPGFAYAAGVDPRIAAPRLAVPRALIPAGSVGIAGEQTGVYPLDSPGGWQLIGRTPARVYDPRRADPICYRPGDWLRFTPVGRDEFERLAACAARGEAVWRVLDEGAGAGEGSR